MGFRIIAHRGFSALAPENTLASFDLALASEFRHIELDAQLTADGVPVVVHDRTLGRTTDGSGPVAKATLGEIKGLDAGSWFPNAEERGYIGLRVPTLEEVLRRYVGRAHILVELKSDEPELPNAVADLVERTGWRDVAGDGPDDVPGIGIISFHLDQVARSQEYVPEGRHGWIVGRLDQVDTQVAGKLGLHGLYAFAKTLTVGEVVEARSTGLDVGAWGTKSRKDLAGAVEAGASGATVDWPDAALEFLREGGLI